MKLLQAVVAMLTLILFFVRQKYVSAGVCLVKTQYSVPGYCGDFNLPSSLTPRQMYLLNRNNNNNYTSDDYALPKYKKDPNIKVDNEDIDGHPIE